MTTMKFQYLTPLSVKPEFKDKVYYTDEIIQSTVALGSPDCPVKYTVLIGENAGYSKPLKKFEDQPISYLSPTIYTGIIQVISKNKVIASSPQRNFYMEEKFLEIDPFWLVGLNEFKKTIHVGDLYKIEKSGTTQLLLVDFTEEDLLFVAQIASGVYTQLIYSWTSFFTWGEKI
jgi:hypothetical protein